MSRISIIPLELFTRENRELVCARLLRENQIVYRLKDRALRETMSEISPPDTKLFSLVEYGEASWAVFCETSLCLIIEDCSTEEALNENFVTDEIKNRAQRHTDFIAMPEGHFLKPFFDLIVDETKDSQFPVSASYVFGSFCLMEKKRIDDQKKSLIKILSEPSILDADDMMSSMEYEDVDFEFPSPDHRLFQTIRDIDPSSKSTTYITWAAIASYSMDDQTYNRTRNLLIALEARLQSTWNRCFAFSDFADQVFDRKTDVEGFEELYWQFVRVLDDAKSVISSTFSSRAGIFFSEMVRTSNLKGEISRLQTKLDLVQKFIEREQRKKNMIYQKTIEVLLFIAAIASVIQVLLPVPLIENQVAAWGALILLFVIGLLAIFRLK